MDYEKAYKKALEIAKKNYDAAQDLCNGSQIGVECFKNTLTNIFPELKESEDEKIKESLMQYIWNIYHREYCPPTPSIETCDKWIAWLEKQSSSSVKWQKNTPDNKPAINHSVLMKTTHGVAEGYFVGSLWFQFRWSSNIKDSDVLAWMELSDLDEQGEQKPFDYEHATITQKDFAPINDTDEEIVEAVKDISVLDMVEHKQEWSEEDEEMTKELIGGFLSSESPYRLTHTSKEIVDWLNSIKDRMKGKEE